MSIFMSRPRHAVAAAVAGFVLLVALGARAQLSLPYKINHYNLRVEPDFAARTLRVKATVDILNPGYADTFSFALADTYQISSLQAIGSKATVARSEGGEVTVQLRRPRRRVFLTFELFATPGKSADEPREVIDDHSLFLLWSDRWYPADFDQWSPVRTTIVLPPGFEVIAPGKRISQRDLGGKVEHVFEAAEPTTSFSVFADSRWQRAERDVGGFHIVTLLHPESRKYADQIFSTSSDVLQYFSELHGLYPFEQFSFVTIEGMYARRAFAGWVGYSPEYLEKEMARTGYDAHETSLLWWGLTSHGRGPGSWQWTEGLGDYVEAMYGEARHKPLPQNFVRFRADYLATPPEQDVTYNELRGNTPQKIVHGKYPWTMQVLRDRIGDEAFIRGIRLLFERYRFRTFSMDEFVATFEAASGQSLRWWREQWLERRGVPEIAFHSTVVGTDAGYRVICQVEQKGETYELPLEIAIKTARGSRIEKVLLRDARNEFTFNSLDEPNEVVLDPGERILMRKVETEFNQLRIPTDSRGSTHRKF